MTNPSYRTGSVTVPVRIEVIDIQVARPSRFQSPRLDQFLATLEMPGAGPYFGWQEMAWGGGGTEEEALAALQTEWMKVQGTLIVAPKAEEEQP